MCGKVVVWQSGCPDIMEYLFQICKVSAGAETKMLRIFFKILFGMLSVHADNVGLNFGEKFKTFVSCDEIILGSG